MRGRRIYCGCRTQSGVDARQCCRGESSSLRGRRRLTRGQFHSRLASPKRNSPGEVICVVGCDCSGVGLVRSGIPTGGGRVDLCVCELVGEVRLLSCVMRLGTADAPQTLVSRSPDRNRGIDAAIGRQYCSVTGASGGSGGGGARCSGLVGRMEPPDRHCDCGKPTAGIGRKGRDAKTRVVRFRSHLTGQSKPPTQRGLEAVVSVEERVVLGSSLAHSLGRKPGPKQQ